MNVGVTYDTPAEKVERAMQIIERFTGLTRRPPTS
jgi:hypothetical protein